MLDNLAWRLHGFEASRDFREPLAEVVAALKSIERLSRRVRAEAKLPEPVAYIARH